MTAISLLTGRALRSVPRLERAAALGDGDDGDQAGKTHDYMYCWHLGCILPRVPAIIVRIGAVQRGTAAPLDRDHQPLHGVQLGRQHLLCGRARRRHVRRPEYVSATHTMLLLAWVASVRECQQFRCGQDVSHDAPGAVLDRGTPPGPPVPAGVRKRG